MDLQTNSRALRQVALRGWPWLAAAVLSLTISLGAAFQLDAAAASVDEAVLAGHAAALAENIEERLLLVGLVTQGTAPQGVEANRVYAAAEVRPASTTS